MTKDLIRINFWVERDITEFHNWQPTNEKSISATMTEKSINESPLDVVELNEKPP